MSNNNLVGSYLATVSKSISRWGDNDEKLAGLMIQFSRKSCVASMRITRAIKVHVRPSLYTNVTSKTEFHFYFF